MSTIQPSRSGRSQAVPAFLAPLVVQALAVGAFLLLFAASRRESPSASTAEVVASFTGAWGVWLVVRNNIWNWPIGIVSSAVFSIVFWNKALFADAVLQVLYVLLGFLGWHLWLRGGENHGRRKMGRVGRTEAAWVTLAFLLSTVIATMYLHSVQDSAPFTDALTTSLSLAAQYLLTRKYIENWLLWIVVDIIYVGLYLNRDLNLTALLYVVFLAMAIAGLRHWGHLLDAEPPAQEEGPALPQPGAGP